MTPDTHSLVICHFEDNRVIRVLVKALIQKWYPTAKLIQKNSAIDAFVTIPTNDPDIVLMDYNFEYATCEQYICNVSDTLREQCPTIILSSDSELDHYKFSEKYPNIPWVEKSDMESRLKQTIDKKLQESQHTV